LWKRVREFRRLMDTAKERAARVRRSPSPIAEQRRRNHALRDNITALYDMLIAPIEPDIADKKTIAFIPTQMLYYLPLHALAKKTDSGLRFLIEDKQIAYLAGADVMSVVQEQDASKTGQGLLAFGNPTGADLPQAQKEVQNIAKVFPTAQVLSGAQATKITLQGTDSLNRRVLHFATHGVLNATRPEKSYIQLAPGAAPDDEKLTVGEVYGLDLNKVDLVTLSACQTALGERNPDGSEITSLAEAFFPARVRRRLLPACGASRTTARHKQWLRSTSSWLAEKAGRALQSAQLKVMRSAQYAHPYYWAPFVLMGDWR
jgi:CHAT domain-containing protein